MEPIFEIDGNYLWNDETKKIVMWNQDKGCYDDVDVSEIPEDVLNLAKLNGYIMPKGLDKKLYGDFDIAMRIFDLANDINEKYKDLKQPLIVVGILKGSFIFMADLVRQLTIPHVVDFIAVSSYGDKIENDGNVRMIMDCRINQKGRDVLIVEDIVDSGYTLNYLVNNFKSRGTNSVSTVTLLDKPLGRKVDFQPDYVGFKLEGDEWVVGYGLDAKEKWRTLPYIATMIKE